ncbi:MAG: serine/threonine protein kinase [Frankiales bacterium]|nr:serine/threonine protein kinase [Frankiales bacterium]
MTEPDTRQLGGRYELGELLGVGGMAQVYRADDARLGRSVAIKVLRPDLARDPAFQARFRREAQSAASLNAPCIVSVYDTGEDDAGVPFIVMELVDGRTLREVLQTEGRLLPQRALEVVADICAALQVAHEAGIVHRDVKPGNVMLNGTGDVKVMDFGIARAVADTSVTMTQTSAVIGTAAYLSPEQARGEHVDARSDLYSTGCLLYELLAGAPPFTGDSPVSVAYQHVREDPLPPSTYDTTLPPDVDAVVLKAMAKNPANRYQSAAEMREDLLRAAAGAPVEATPVLAPDAVASLRGSTVLVPARPAGPSTLRRNVVYGGFGLLLLAIVVALAALVRGLLVNDTGVVTAPELVGLTQVEATRELAALGLRIGEVSVQFRNDKPAGTVIGQKPQEGIVVDQEGGTVNLTISRGIELGRVPQVVGSSHEDAERVLADAGLNVEDVSFRNGDLPAGQVLAIDPAGGEVVRARTSVRLVVATGRIEVPDVRGRAVEEAVRLLHQAGLSVAIEPIPDPRPVGQVIEQRSAGDTVERGSAVRIGVAQEPPPPPPSPSPQPVASAPPEQTAPSPAPSGAASPAA